MRPARTLGIDTRKGFFALRKYVGLNCILRRSFLQSWHGRGGRAIGMSSNCRSCASLLVGNLGSGMSKSESLSGNSRSFASCSARYFSRAKRCNLFSAIPTVARADLRVILRWARAYRNCFFAMQSIFACSWLSSKLHHHVLEIVLNNRGEETA